MVFPSRAAGLFPRHPSQLYEAMCEGVIVFLVLRWLTHRRLALKHPGWVSGAFLLSYGLARIFCEMFRDPEEGAPFNFGFVTTGMVYSLPMVAIGAMLILRAGKAESRVAAGKG